MLLLDDPAAVCELIAVTIGMVEGAIDLVDGLVDLQNAGSTQGTAVGRALAADRYRRGRHAARARAGDGLAAIAGPAMTAPSDASDDRLLTADRDLIVVGLGFGDEGKGATVDWLCAQGDVASVVRFNGGAQAAHNVVADGGPPHLPTVRVGNPGRDADLPGLDHAGGADPARRGGRNPCPTGRLRSAVPADSAPGALLTTPVHAAANRTREDARGAGGTDPAVSGIGETTWYDLATRAGVRAGQSAGELRRAQRAADIAVRVRDCLDERALTRKLDALAAFYRPLLETGARRTPRWRGSGPGLFGVRPRGPDRRRAAPRGGAGR